MTTKKRLLPADRKEQILTAALAVASRPGGWARLTRDAVAKEAGCCEALPSTYFGTMVAFRRVIMRSAIKREALPVIAQGVAAGYPQALKAPAELKTKALLTLGA